jgi:Tir chaperone protein (CesT) family
LTGCPPARAVVVVASCMSLEVAIELLKSVVPIEPEAGKAENERILNFDGGLALRLEELPRDAGLLLKGTVAQLPTDAEERATTIRKILQTNLARLRFQSETAAIDPAAGELFLWRRVKAPLQRSDQEFLSAVEQFLNSLEFWQSRLSVSIDAPAPNMRLIFP